MKEFRAFKGHNAHKYIIFTLSPDQKQIVIEKTSSSDKWDDFLGDLPEYELRWAVYNFQLDTKEFGLSKWGDRTASGVMDRILLIKWYVLSSALWDSASIRVDCPVQSWLLKFDTNLNRFPWPDVDGREEARSFLEANTAVLERSLSYANILPIDTLYQPPYLSHEYGKSLFLCLNVSQER